MRSFLVIFLVYCAAIEARVVKDPFEVRSGLIKLSTEPFDVPAINETRKSGKIVYGTTATAGQFPHYVLIFVNRPASTVQCGAGLLSTTWVLTAKHCLNNAKGVELRFGLTHRDYPEQKSVGKALAVHTTVDVGLILLKDTLKITSLVKPALLPRISQVSDMFVDKTATLAGLGVENQKTYAVSTYVKYASFRIMSNDECGKVFGPQPVTIICAKSDTSLASSCPGDSGSPLVIYEGTNTIVVGVVGFGAGAGCDLGYPVGYSRMSAQLDWVAYYTGIAKRK